MNENYDIKKKARTANAQYKTAVVQWFARVWFPHQRFTRWIGTQPENAAVSYCQTLAVSLGRHYTVNKQKTK